MRESVNDLMQLQKLLDESHGSSGTHLRSAFDQGRRLGAERLAGALDGIFELHLAVLSGSGAPLVAPLDAIFFRGRVWIGIPATSLRTRLVRRDPRVSISYHSPSVALIAHGVAHEAQPEDPQLDEFLEMRNELYVDAYGPGWRTWFAAKQAASVERDFTGHLEPRVMFAKGM